MAVWSVPVPAKLARNPPDFALSVRQHRTIFFAFLDFVGRPRLGEPLLQIVERIGAHRATLAAQDHESDRSVEPRNFSFRQRSRDFFG
jgi:hypothetical protein